LGKLINIMFIKAKIHPRQKNAQKSADEKQETGKIRQKSAVV